GPRLACSRRADETRVVKHSARSAIDDSPSRLALALEAARARRPDALDLTASHPTRVGLSYAAYGPASDWAAPGAGAYSPDALGLESARRAVAQHYPGSGARPDPERLLLVSSSSEAY